jgi:adenosylcobinamide-GDP ribazoletransferase
VLAPVFVGLAPLGGTAAAILTLGLSMLLTGAFHEDGFADTADALGGGYTKEKVFLILKDSRIGAFGACAIAVAIGGRMALLARLDGDAAWYALPFVFAAARAVPVWQIALLPYVTAPDAAKSSDVMRARAPQAIVATVWPLAIAVALVVTHRVPVARVAAALGVAALVGVMTAVRYVRRVGGVTGDFLGATEQLCELASFAALAWGRP